MIGHVYCKFTDEEDASDALQVMNDRYYDGRKMEVEFSPVQNFQEVQTQTDGFQLHSLSHAIANTPAWTGLDI
jgi:RNA recognition motif-containing protein